MTTQKHKLWQNSTQIVTKLKNVNCDKTQILKLWQKSTQIVTKLNKIVLWQKNCDNCDKTLTIKLWQNSKNQIVTKWEEKKKMWPTQKKIVPKFENSNCDKT